LDDTRVWGLVTQNEIFFNLNSPTNGPGGGFDQNRFFVGLNKKINEYLSVDGGYQLQAINTDESSLFNTLNHILLTSIHHRCGGHGWAGWAGHFGR